MASLSIGLLHFDSCGATNALDDAVADDVDEDDTEDNDDDNDDEGAITPLDDAPNLDGGSRLFTRLTVFFSSALAIGALNPDL